MHVEYLGQILLLSIFYMQRYHISIIHQLQYENSRLIANYNLLIEKMNRVIAENDELKKGGQLSKRRNKRDLTSARPSSTTLYYLSRPTDDCDPTTTLSPSTCSSITMSEY